MKYAAMRHMKCTAGFYPESSVHEILPAIRTAGNMVEPAPSRRLLDGWEDGGEAYRGLGLLARVDKGRSLRYNKDIERTSPTKR